MRLVEDAASGGTATLPAATATATAATTTTTTTTTTTLAAGATAAGEGRRVVGLASFRALRRVRTQSSREPLSNRTRSC